MIKNKCIRFGYYWGSLYISEGILRLATTGTVLSPALFYALLFSAAAAGVLYILTTALSPKANRRIALFALGAMGVLYASQVVYYDIFGTFYIAYSAGNALQVLEFAKDVLQAIGRNILPIALLFAPFAILLFLRGFRKRLFETAHSTPRMIPALAALVLMLHAGTLELLTLSKAEDNSAYRLYYGASIPDFSVDTLGLLTFMRRDAQHHLFGHGGDHPNASDTYDPDREVLLGLLDSTTVPADAPRRDHIIPPVTIEGGIIDSPSAPPPEPSAPLPPAYNQLDIDFNRLMAETGEGTLGDLHSYFSQIPPSIQNEHTGLFEGDNLILITAEGFSHLALDPEVTPTLYRLVHEGIHFKDFYTPIWGVSTSDGEYVALTGLIPKPGVWSMKRSGKNQMPYVLGNQFKALGYLTRAYHNHTYTYYGREVSHPNLGYLYTGVGNGLVIKDTWPESDVEMMDVTIPDYMDTPPFHTYYMTVSGHLQYNFGGNFIARKNRDLVSDLPYSDMAKAYLATQIELDRAVQKLLEGLEERGLAEKTVIALTADHYPYGLDHEVIEELAGKPVDETFELYRNACILYKKGMAPEIVSEPCSSLDLLPTLSNLFGLPYDSRLLMGRDVFSDIPPLVVFSNRSFITDRGRYHSGKGQWANSATNPLEETAQKSYIKAMRATVAAKFYASSKILELDYYAICAPQTDASVPAPRGAESSKPDKVN